MTYPNGLRSIKRVRHRPPSLPLEGSFVVGLFLDGMGPEIIVESAPKRSFCNTCGYLVHNPCNILSHEHKFLSELAGSAEKGCYFCCLIYRAAVAFCSDWLNVPEKYIGLALECQELNKSLEIVILDDTKQLRLEIFVDADTSPYTEIPCKMQIPQDSGSEACLRRLKNWLEFCQTHHPKCIQSSSPPLPDRVIEVLSSAGHHRLRLKISGGLIGRYVALSHCWGTGSATRPFITTKANIKLHQKRFHWYNLSKTFQDAISISRHLQIRCLWIDSLCIIQDDAEDWGQQASKMSSIYSNATLTIAATRAANGSDGCLSTRSPEKKIGQVLYQQKSTDFYVHLSPPRHYIYSALRGSIEAGIARSHSLYERGWYLQERLLSPRIVQYGVSEMVWICTEMFQCECGFDEATMQSDSLVNMYASPLHIETRATRIRLWTKILEEYTAAKLTNDSDILPALSGLAKIFKTPGNRYVAGIWEQNLTEWLCWQSVKPLFSRHPKQYTAPSFSWASRIRPVLWNLGLSGINETNLVDILGFYTAKQDGQSFGKVTDGFLKVRILMYDDYQHTLKSLDKRAHLIIDADKPIRTDLVCFDTQEGFDTRFEKDFFCLPILGPLPGSPMELKFCALLLEKVGDKGYRRVALLQAHFGKLSPGESLFSDYPLQVINII